ncbi:hypothetical protein J1N35_011802 [Gossypium stocksii]|uniref:Uncharacterized protein n=1 Tax=Gossypium stocksii TaxID=47602 RepID=A0A9D3W334_9ROSI|nr:hypothetical protein J1N35_011802 [Gossypium stocksii]
MVMVLKEVIVELKGKLTIYKAALGNKGFVATPKSNVDALKPKEFKGIRFTKDLDNFLSGMEQYFCSNASWMMLLRRERYIPFLHGWIEAMDKAIVIMSMSSRAYKAMNVAEYFFKLGPKKYKPKPFRPKFKLRGNGGRDKDKPAKNGNGKVQKLWEKNKRWPLTCFHCDDLHMVRDCSKKVALSTMKCDDRVTKNLGSILGGVEDNASHGLIVPTRQGRVEYFGQIATTFAYFKVSIVLGNVPIL